jgi:geranylgeranyl diphosphate synthase type II
VLSAPEVSFEAKAKAGLELAKAAGCSGMIAGQVMDLANEGKAVGIDAVRNTDRLKTGELIRVAAVLGCIAAGADEEQTEAARVYARNFGAAFQIVDDILDVSVSTRELGKNALSDVKNRKTTYVTLLGKDGAYEKASSLTEKAVAAISGYKGSEYLVEFAKSALDRRK